MSDSLFKSKSKLPIEGYNIANIYGKRVVKGDIGIEIEVEGNQFRKTDVPQPWGYHKDGSLRGLDNAEYVLNAPIAFDKVPEAISILWNMFEEYGSKLDVSNRTSVHVHLNMQKFHLNRLTAFMALYFSVEELLTQWCGDHRVGNLFCLRAKDATGIVSQIKSFIQSNGATSLPDGLHYAGLNANALFKFGSLEIRTLRGCTDPQTIIDWVAILERIYKISADFPDPRELPGRFSSDGPTSFLEMILGDKTQKVLDDIGYTSQQTRNALYEGIRLAQDLCYCRDWSLYKPVEIKTDPFGRKSQMPITLQGYGNQIGLLQAIDQQTVYNQIYANTASIPMTIMPAVSPDPYNWDLPVPQATGAYEEHEEEEYEPDEDDDDIEEEDEE